MRQNDKVIDTRTNKVGTIELVETKNGDKLYTVNFGNNNYGRYYSSKMKQYFKLAQIEQPKVNCNELYKNVAFVDFKNKVKFANYESWLSWIEQFKKVG